MKAQRPPLQVAVEPARSGQTLPHRAQLRGSVSVSTQLPLQLVAEQAALHA